MRQEVLLRGVRLSIRMHAEGTRCPVRDFLDSLQPRDQRKIARIMQEAADLWPLSNRRKCEELHGYPGLWEFKANQVRLLFFRDAEGDIILTNGFTKRQRKLPRQETDRALRIRERWQSGEDAGNGCSTVA